MNRIRQMRVSGPVLFLGSALLIWLLGAVPAGAADRAGTWDGNVSIGISFVEAPNPFVPTYRTTQSALGVSGDLRYWFTDHFAMGPSVSGAFADTSKVYVARGMLRFSTTAIQGSRPLEIYLDAGAGVIVVDEDYWKSRSDLDVPFGGGFKWRAGNSWGLFAGGLLNVTTNDNQNFYPEIYGGIWMALR